MPAAKLHTRLRTSRPDTPARSAGSTWWPTAQKRVRVLSAVANSGCSEQPTAAGLPLPPASKQLAASTSTRVTGVRVPCTSANGGNHPPTRSPGMILVHQTPTWVELHIRPQQHSIADAHRPTVQHDAVEVAAAQGGSRSGPTLSCTTDAQPPACSSACAQLNAADRRGAAPEDASGG